jgi:hypothetical protein
MLTCCCRLVGTPTYLGLQLVELVVSSAAAAAAAAAAAGKLRASVACVHLWVNEHRDVLIMSSLCMSAFRGCSKQLLTAFMACQSHIGSLS